MNTLPLPPVDFSRVTVEAMLKSLEVGLALTALAWLALRAFQKTNAATRFAIWWIVLGFTCLPLAVTILSPRNTGRDTAASPDSSPVNRVATIREDNSNYNMAAVGVVHAENGPHTKVTTPGLPTNDALVTKGDPRSNVTPPSTLSLVATPQLNPYVGETTEAAASRAGGESPGALATLRGDSWPRIVVTIWLAICATLLARLTFAWFHLSRLKRTATQPPVEYQSIFTRVLSEAGLKRMVHLKLSGHVGMPVAAGITEPVVIIPAGLLEKLSQQEFEQFLRHELAHLARYDDWTNLAQHLVTALLWFHPAAWWIARRLNLEREIACDDQVLRATNRPGEYALSLTRLAELNPSPSNFSLVTGVWRTRSQLGQRVEMLLDNSRNVSPRPWWAGLMATTGVMTLVILLLFRLGPIIVLAQAPASPQNPPANAPTENIPNGSQARQETATNSINTPQPSNKSLKLLEEEIALTEKVVSAMQNKLNSGAGSQEEVNHAKRDLLQLKRQLAEIEQGSPGMDKSKGEHPASGRQRDLLNEEIKLAEMSLAEAKKQVELGVISTTDLVKFQRDVLGLKRQLTELEERSALISNQLPVAASSASATSPAVVVAGEKNPIVRGFKQRQLLEQELFLLEEQLEEVRQKRAQKLVSVDEERKVQRDVLSVKRQLAALEDQYRKDLVDVAIPGIEEKKRKAEEEAKKKQAEELEQAKKLEAEKKERLASLLKIAQTDADSAVRNAALMSIGGLQLADSIEPLSKIALNDSDLEARKSAIVGINAVHSEKAIQSLVNLYDQSTDEKTRLLIIQFLNLGNTVVNGSLIPLVPPYVAAKLTQIVQNESNALLKNAALERIQFISGHAGTDALISIYDQVRELEIRQKVVYYLCTRTGKKALAKVEAIAQSDTEPTIRVVAAQRLGRMDQDISLPLLVIPGE